MVRLPMEAVDYVNELCTTQDMSACEIVRQIVVERMVNDRTNGEFAPFAHKLAPRPRGRPKNSEIEAEAEASDAPHVAGPVPARSAGMSLSSEDGGSVSDPREIRGEIHKENVGWLFVRCRDTYNIL